MERYEELIDIPDLGVFTDRSSLPSRADGADGPMFAKHPHTNVRGGLHSELAEEHRSFRRADAREISQRNDRNRSSRRRNSDGSRGGFGV